MNQAPAIKLENLGKTFGKGKSMVRAVKAINLTVPAGQVYGFLGPNGAGKTTSIRLLMGLIRPTHGKAFIFGESVQRTPEILKKVGALVEGASFYNFLTGYDNLAVLSRTANDYSPPRIKMLLDQVGLTEHADRSVKGYSNGMKQRLGIAAALLSDPELVILDEPTNGLDPAGIQEMRVFIRQLVEGLGKTVFLSSHHLNEVEQICDSVAIINQGEIIQTGNVKDLLAKEQSYLRLSVTPQQKALELLQSKLDLQIENEWITTILPPKHIPTLVKYLVRHGIEIHQVVQAHQSLEEFFLEVTNGSDLRPNNPHLSNIKGQDHD